MFIHKSVDIHKYDLSPLLRNAQCGALSKEFPVVNTPL